MRARGSVGVAGVGALHPVRKRKIAGIKNVLAGLVIFAILYFLGNNYDSFPGTCHPLAVEPSVPSPHGPAAFPLLLSFFRSRQVHR